MTEYGHYILPEPNICVMDAISCSDTVPAIIEGPKKVLVIDDSYRGGVALVGILGALGGMGYSSLLEDYMPKFKPPKSHVRHQGKKECERRLKRLKLNWHREYKAKLMEYAGLTEQEAQDCLDAGMGDYDYSDDPRDAVLEELSCWTD